MSEIVEVLQRELAITRASDEHPILATVNVAMCTVFLGYEENNRIGFLGHFDFPCNTTILPSLFQKLAKLSGPGATYKCRICGGNKYGWARSSVTRRKIREAVGTLAPHYEIGLQIENEEAFLPLFKKIALQFDTRTGDIGEYPQRSESLSLKALLLNQPVRWVYEPKPE